MWPPWGGVIGDKVTLMFRLFNTHLFTPHLLCRHLKAGFFSLGKSNVPRKGTQWFSLGVSNVLRLVQLSTLYCGPTTPHFLSDRQLFPRFCIAAAPLRLFTFLYFFYVITKRSLGNFFCGRTWASICPNLLICMFLQNSSFAHG